MEEKKHFRHIMLYYFKKGKNATETHRKICAVYGEGAVTNRTCQKWFAKFRAGDFLLDRTPRSGRLVQVDSHQIETIIENNQHYTTIKSLSLVPHLKNWNNTKLTSKVLRQLSAKKHDRVLEYSA